MAKLSTTKASIPVKSKAKAKAKTVPAKETKPTKTASSLASIVEEYSSDFVNTQVHLDSVEQLILEIIAGPGVGKTWAALSASEYWPKDPAAKRSKMCVLDDVMHIAWDAAALAGVKPRKIRPRYSIDVPALLAKQRKSGKPLVSDILEAIDVVADEMGNIVAHDPNVKVVIDDTWSRLDRRLVSFWFHPENIKTTYAGMDDTMRTWGCIYQAHNQYFNLRTELPGDVISIILFHGKIEDPQDKTAQKNKSSKKNVLQLGDDVWITPQITGQAGGMLIGDATAIFALTQSKPPKGVQPQRFLNTIPAQGIYSKNRFQGILEDKEPADMRALINKINAACA